MDFRDYAAKETSELTARLTKAAAAAAEQAAKHVSDEAQKVADGLRAQLQTAAKEKAGTAALLKDAHAQSDKLQADLRASGERVEAASRQLEDARKTAANEAAQAESRPRATSRPRRARPPRPTCARRGRSKVAR